MTAGRGARWGPRLVAAYGVALVGAALNASVWVAAVAGRLRVGRADR